VTPARAAVPLALAACLFGCEGKRAAAPDAGILAAEHVEVGRSTHTLVPEAADAAASPDSSGTGESGDADAGAGDAGALVGEERDRDPRSETVKLKVIVDARRQAHVIWGRKDFGVAPLEIERPRNSGPLDLIVVAPGYLPLHARALTDRDDVLSLRLYSAAEAPQLLGYRPEPTPAPESGSATSPISPRNKGENARPRGSTAASNGKTGDEKFSATKLSTKPTAKKQLK
jgi:hypothetical protein